MKRLRFLPALLVVLSACSENIIEQNPLGSDEMGSVSIALTTDLRSETVVTKAGEKPNPDDFWVSIYKADDQKRLYSDSFANTKDKEIKLNAGDYRLVAQHGDSLGCGFDKPYYMADPTFKVTGRNTQVEAVAKLANVKMSVVYDPTISDAYSDYCVIVKHQKYTSKQLRFNKGETRFGYLPGGEVVIQVYAVVDGEWKYYQTAPVEYSPNDFVVLTVTGDTSEGNLVINIKVDNTVEGKNETVEIPAITVPQGAPVITLAGFEGENNTHVFVEGMTEGANATASFIARASLSHCYLTTESSYLAAKGVPAQVDFANLTTDQKATLKAVGFSWDENMTTSRKLSFIDFSGVIAKMLTDTKTAAEDVNMAKFTLKVEDSVAKTTETSFNIVSAAVKAGLEVNPAYARARRVDGPVFSINTGNMALLKLQTSTDGKTWTNVNAVPEQNGYTYTYERLALNPSTTYYLRAIYNDNEITASPVISVTTEAAQQLGNAGFEEWTEGQVKSYDIIGDTYQYTYYPWTDGTTDKWWDTNNAETTGTSSTPAYLDKKCFPMVSFMPGRTGGKAAQIMAIAVNDGNTNSTSLSDAVPGEIFIGTYGGTRNHSFPSRPDKMNFWFKYDIRTDDDHSSDTYHAEIVVYNGSDVIGSGKLDYNTSSDITAWTQASVDISYTVLDKPATAIYVQFRQSTNETPVYNMNVSITYGNTRTAGVHGGSILTIDDIELIYE